VNVGLRAADERHECRDWTYRAAEIASTASHARAAARQSAASADTAEDAPDTGGAAPAVVR
jgi:hypothetical protein